jgi:two-component system sporulation sensor kinase A
MQDADQSYDQLLADNTVLRQRVATLEAALAEQTKRETVFEAHERRYQHWMENTLGLLCVHDLNGIILEVNTAAAQALGFHPRDGVGRSLRDFLAPSVRPGFKAYLERIRQQPSDSGLMRVMTRRKEERVWFYRNVRYEPSGAKPYILGHAVDITERVQAEQALQQAHDELERRVAERTGALQRVNTQLQVEIEARHRMEAELRSNEAHFRSLVQNALDIIALFALDGTVHYYSPSIERILGHRPKDLIGRNVFGAIHPEDIPRVKDVIVRLAQCPGAPQEIEVRLRHRDETWRDFEAIGSVPLDDLSSGYILVNARDITERKRVEAALRESEARLRAFANALPDLAFVLDQHGRYIEVLTTQEHLLYREAEQLKGYLLHEVLPQTVADRFLAMIHQTLNTDTPQVFEYSLDVPAGHRWFEGRTSAMHGVSDTSKMVVWVSRDITDRKRAEAERKRLDAQLQQSEHLASLGTFAAGVAHELNNPLGAIRITAEHARKTLAAESEDSGVQDCLTEILDDAQRCAQIVKRVLHFAQQADRTKSLVALHPLIRMAELHTRRYVQHNGGRLRLVLAPQQPYIMAHEAEIDLAFVNLIRNAVEASEPGGLVTIQTDVSGGKVYVSVQDMGRGLSKGEQQRAFDPFYTTREAAGGTGLGLSIVHRIITDHDGQIRLESVPGQGTTVHVRLPLASA